MKLVLIAILLVPLLVACGPNKIEVKFESDTENLNQLKNRMMFGDIAYVIENAANHLTVDHDIYNGLGRIVDVREASIAQGEMNDLVKSVENTAMKVALSSEGTQQSAALELLRRSRLASCYSYMERNESECQKIREADNLDAFEKVELGNMLGRYPDFAFDTNDQEFLRDELCRAVGINEFEYTVLLISLADFDVGLLRCIEPDGRTKQAYRGSGLCPKSLRREAGVNAQNAIHSRISAWRNNLEREGAFDSESIKELKGKIGRSFDGLPNLTGVNSMNDLLDKYNKWNAGGECTTQDLLKSGVTLPQGW